MSNNELNKIDTNMFTYKNFKFLFDGILDKVYKIKSDKLFLDQYDNNQLETLLEEAINHKEIFFRLNKRSYYEKIKIHVYIFLLRLEVKSIYLYD